MDPVKIGVVGCGNIFKLAHLPALKKLKGAEVVACADIDKDRAEEGSKLLGVPYFTSAEDLFETDVDAVEILTPTYTHSELAIKALKAGKHVFVEKPIALHGADGRKMIETAEKEGLLLFVGHVRRFDKRWIVMKQIVSKRNVVPMYIRKTEVQNLPFPAEYWYWQEDKSGGVALDLGVHVVDFIRWFFESEPIRVFAAGKQIKKEAKVNDTYDHFTMMIEFEGGKVGLCEVSWTYPYPSRYGVFYHHVDVVGKNGRIRYTPMDTPIVGIAKAEFEMPRFSPLLSTFPDAFIAEVQHFVDCIRHGIEPVVTAHDALVALEVVEAGKESAKRGEAVSLDKGGDLQ